MSLKLVKHGKVADIYESDKAPGMLFFRRTDRFSIRNTVFPSTILYKGLILNQMSVRWMQMIENEKITPNHLNPLSNDARSLLYNGASINDAGCIIVAEKCIPIPIECIVRGYYTPDSRSWASYKIDSTICGNVLPKGLKESEQLSEEIYTPSTKAAVGSLDEDITFEQSITVIRKLLEEHNEIPAENKLLEAEKIANHLKDVSIKIYKFMHAFAKKHNIIIADTKLEFGIRVSDDGKSYEILLIDEVGTPDTSRFWDCESYRLDYTIPTMDKHFLRDYAFHSLGWSHKKIPPELPIEILRAASDIYCQIYYKLFDNTIETISEQIMWQWKTAYVSLNEERERARAQREINDFYAN